MIRAAALALIVSLPAAPALALGGDAASEASSSLERHVVLVHGSRGNLCTGSVIGPRLVLTAAHCVSGSSRYIVSYREGGSRVTQGVFAIEKHPGYRPGQAISLDIALLRLQSALPPSLSAISLDAGTSADPVAKRQAVAGFGLTREKDDASVGTLRRASVDVIQLDARHMRLGNQSETLRICRGDSGGPTFSEGLTGVSLTGVVFAVEKRARQGCGETGWAVRVGPQRGWIDSIRARWGE